MKCKATFALLLYLPQESLSEKIQRERLTVSERLKQYGIYLGSWLLSTGLAFGCAASIYFLCQYEQQVGEQEKQLLGSNLKVGGRFYYNRQTNRCKKR